MNDPHVVAISYRLVTSDGVTYDNPPAIEWDIGVARVRLDQNLATVTMVDHFASAEEARRAIEPHLRAWEIGAGLRYNNPDFAFEFLRVEMVDRNPTAGDLSARETAQISVKVSASISITRQTYPPPPRQFIVSPDVETMWLRYVAYRQGREPLAAMAYACLTLIEASAGSRRQAAQQYAVDFPVLKKLGDLTSNIGDSQTARKLKSPTGARPHTPGEIRWIEEVIRALIRRAAEYASSPHSSLQPITMANFPPP